MSGKSRIYKRLSGLAATGAAPGVLVGLIGDLFTPRGGWIVVAIIGVIATILAVYLLASLWGPNGTARPWWRRLTDKDEDARWIWDAKTPFGAHGIHVLVVFSFACLFCAQQSFAAAKNGGVLAKEIPMVADTQQQLGISKAILEQQIVANKHLESIDSQAKNFKQERSADPRKELANKGVKWTSEALREAIHNRDVQTLDLFLQGGMRISNQIAHVAFAVGDEATRLLFSEYPALFDSSQCLEIFDYPHSYVLRLKELKQATAGQKKFVRSLCGQAEGRIVLKQEIDRAKEFLPEELAKNAKANEAILPAISACVRKHINAEPELRAIANSGSWPSNIDLDTEKMHVEIRQTKPGTSLKGILERYCEKAIDYRFLPHRSYYYQNKLERAQLLTSWLG